jgi:hypothetical protein
MFHSCLQRAELELKGQKKHFITLKSQGAQLVEDASHLPGFQVECVNRNLDQWKIDWSSTVQVSKLIVLGCNIIFCCHRLYKGHHGFY